MQPGDAGGPVLDTSGTVLGVLLPASGDPTRVLPQGVTFAARAEAVTALLAAAGVQATRAAPEGFVAPEDLAMLAADMTVLVSCWDD